jgi:CubicO group peptidase (beta-lactamase class C family)
METHALDVACALSRNIFPRRNWQRNIPAHTGRATQTASIAIVCGDKVVFTKVFGIADLETGEPTSPDMLFQIGSLDATDGEETH